MQRLVIDTDPGVDDALALLMAHAHPDAVVEAVLVVAGNVPLGRTVANACTVLDQIGATTPVYAGCDRPLLLVHAEDAPVHGEDGLGDIGFAPSSRALETEHAAAALVRMASAAPGELTLVCLGPLTNVAVALALDPMLPLKLARLVIMGGAVNGKGNTPHLCAEYNIYADPEAAHVVLTRWQAAGRVFDLVDWELTVAHAVPGPVFDGWLTLGTPISRFFGDVSAKLMSFVERWSGLRVFPAADPLAMAVALDPALVTQSARHAVSVELGGRHSRGMTVVDWMQRSGGAANARIILAVDTARFHALIEQGLRGRARAS
jgi:purine nucleosidase